MRYRPERQELFASRLLAAAAFSFAGRISWCRDRRRPRTAAGVRPGRPGSGLFCGMDLFPNGRSWSRFVALGDSLTAGRGDFGTDGTAIGWN